MCIYNTDIKSHPEPRRAAQRMHPRWLEFKHTLHTLAPIGRGKPSPLKGGRVTRQIMYLVLSREPKGHNLEVPLELLLADRPSDVVAVATEFGSDLEGVRHMYHDVRDIQYHICEKIMHVYMYMYTCMYMYKYMHAVNTCVCVCVCVCVQAYVDYREGERDDCSCMHTLSRAPSTVHTNMMLYIILCKAKAVSIT